MTNRISEPTRRNIFDELRMSNVSWSGRLDEDDFLQRIFDLTHLPSDDRRCANMAADIHQHRHNWNDWPDDWVFDDPRLNLLRCDDDVLLRFLAETIHPVVRGDQAECERLAFLYNQHLSADGFEIAPQRHVSSRPIYEGRARIAGADNVPADAHAAADYLASAHITAQIGRMNASVHTDPPLAIGTAKEFVETICKGILAARGVEHGNEDLPRLIRSTRAALAIEDEDPNSSVRKLMNGIATIMVAVAEIRSTRGTGHGPAPDAEMPEPVLARLIVKSAVAIGLFLLDMHRSTEIAEAQPERVA